MFLEGNSGNFPQRNIRNSWRRRIQEVFSSYPHPHHSLLIVETERTSENHKLYHDWRSAGARYAVPTGTENQFKQKIASSGIHEQCRALANPLQIWSEMGETQSHGFVLQIITDAIILDFRMLQQKAYFMLSGAKEFEKSSDGRYDPALMEIRYGKDPSQKSRVVLVVAPLLLKKGDLQGQNYDVGVVIERAQVDIEAPKGKRSYLGK